MTSLHVETAQFANGNQARIVCVPQATSAAQIIDALELPLPRALLILNGGTARLEPDLQQRLAQTIGVGLARAVVAEQMTVITGATDAGVFALFGQGLAAYERTAPCIGVTIAEPVTWPGKPSGDVPLEPHHSHVVLVAGSEWGTETETMYDLAAALGQDCPTVAIFAGGGEIVIHEMQANVRQGRTMILLAGSGRTTDAVLAARAGQPTNDPRLDEIARSGTIIPFDMREPPEALHALIRRICFEAAAEH